MNKFHKEFVEKLLELCLEEMAEKLLRKYMEEHMEKILKESLHKCGNLVTNFARITVSNNAKYL